MTIELSPEIEAEVVRVAAERGMEPGTYASGVVTESVAWRLRQVLPPQESFQSFVERINRDIPPILGNERATFDREMIYSDDLEKFQS